MTKTELQEKISTLKQETHDALQLMYNELNTGQRKKIVKNPKVKELLGRYEVIL